MFCLRPLSGRLIVSCEVKRRGSRKVGKGVSIWDMEYGNDETQNPGGIRGLGIVRELNVLNPVAS